VSSGIIWSVREAAVPEAPVAQTAVEALFRAHAQELGRYLVAVVRDRSLAEDLRHRALRALRRGRRFQRAVLRLAGSGPATHEDDEELVALLDLLERELSPDYGLSFCSATSTASRLRSSRR